MADFEEKSCNAIDLIQHKRPHVFITQIRVPCERNLLSTCSYTARFHTLCGINASRNLELLVVFRITGRILPDGWPSFENKKRSGVLWGVQ